MAPLLEAALDLAEGVETAATPGAAARLLFAAGEPFGLRSLFAGSFPLLPQSRPADMVGGMRLYARMPVPGWLDAYYRRGLDNGNPVIFAPCRRATPFRWSDPGFDDLRNWAGLDLARELGLEDGFAVPWHGPGGRVGVISLGFERFGFSPREQRALELAALLTVARMATLAEAGAGGAGLALSVRERDCLSYVAEGFSDGEIADRLGISQTTAHAHVENAKRKLGARTRAQAVARLYASGLLWSAPPAPQRGSRRS